MTTAQDLLSELSTTIFFGSGRSKLPTVEIEGEVSSTLLEIGTRDPEDRLLNQLAVVLIYSRAGTKPAKLPRPVSEFAPDEQFQSCGDVATSLIATLISGGYPRLLPEAFDLLVRSQTIVSPVLLPDILNLGVSQQQLRDQIQSIGGERGKWLAKQNPSWAYVLDTTRNLVADDGTSEFDVLFESWSSLPKQERAVMIRTVRRADPTTGRRLLEQSWREESAPNRELFLSGLVESIAVEDEQFLELAAKDRSAGVRRVAVELLSRISHSVFVNEAVGIANSFISVSHNIVGKLRFVVNLPDSYDPLWQRFGIEEKSWIKDVGDKAWYLSQWAALIPVTDWTTKYGVSASELLAIAEKSEWADSIVLGLSKSAQRSTEIDWKYETLRYWSIRRDTRTSITALLPSINDLGDRAVDLIIELMNIFPEPLNDSHPAIQHVRSYDGRWTAEFSLNVSRRLVQTVTLPKEHSGNVWLVQSLLTESAYRIPINTAKEVMSLFAEIVPITQGWSKLIDEFLNVICFRLRLYQEILR